MAEKRNYSFVQHKTCEFFPCHAGIDPDDFNCLFCYCPLYPLKERCGGDFSYDNEQGIKDCSDCTIPHRKEKYNFIIDQLTEVIEMTRK